MSKKGKSTGTSTKKAVAGKKPVEANETEGAKLIGTVGKAEILLAKPSKTKPTIFELSGVIEKLEQAYSLNATHEEAANHAGVVEETIKSHIKLRTEMIVRFTDIGEDYLTTFDQLVNTWKAHMTLLAKKKIYNQLADDESKGTQDAWRLLERKQKAEYGLDVGVGSVDGNAPAVEIDHLSEARKRAGKYAKPKEEKKKK